MFSEMVLHPKNEIRAPCGLGAEERSLFKATFSALQTKPEENLCSKERGTDETATGFEAI